MRALVGRLAGQRCHSAAQVLIGVCSHVSSRSCSFTPRGRAKEFSKHGRRQTKLQIAAAIASEDSRTVPAAPTPSAPVKKQVGVLQRVPAVAPPEETVASAVKRCMRIAGSAKIKNEAEKERNRAARQMDLLMKELCAPLTRYLDAYPAPESLHPFERALLELTVGGEKYLAILRKVRGLRKSIAEVGKSYASRAASAPNKASATAAATEGVAAMQQLFNKNSSPVAALKEVGKQLRKLPYVDPVIPTIALVGAPNVGKSSLVKCLSSGTPEVCNYPFTTRSIKMGHFYVGGTKHQVTDTPGVLSRPDQERNKMEQLTLAALDYLPSVGVFVMDLTEECGTGVLEQWQIRQELRSRFPHKLWLDVLTKADMLHVCFAEADCRVQQGVGQDQVAGQGAGDGAVASGVDVVVRLPDAARVSSVTEEGLEGLKEAVVLVLEARAAATAAAAAAAEEEAQGEAEVVVDDGWAQ